MDHFLKHAQFTVHKEGYLFVSLFIIATLLLFWLWEPLGWIGVILTVWCAYFFRNPKRITPPGDDLIIAPADGRVEKIITCSLPEEIANGDTTTQYKRVSIFMNVFNVHINRHAVNGIIKKIAYIPGKFFNASLDKASTDNERNSLLIETPKGIQIGVTQIAGLVARRILCSVKEGDDAVKGHEFGLIRFGSRVDVFIPEDVEIYVFEGQTTVGGETVLADLSAEKSSLSLSKKPAKNTQKKTDQDQKEDDKDAKDEKSDKDAQ